MGKEQKNGFNIAAIIIVIAAIAVFGGFFGYQYLKLQNIQEEAKAPAVESPVTPSAQIQSSQENDKSNKNIFVNNPYHLQFTLPDNYFVGSNDFGIVDPAEAEAFFFRRESNNYSAIPTLDVSTKMKLSPGQTMEQLAQTIYDVNKAKNYVTTNLKGDNYSGVDAYEFSLQTGYNDLSGYQLIEFAGARVVFLYRNGKVFRFLQTGNDSDLTSILNSMKFK